MNPKVLPPSPRPRSPRSGRSAPSRSSHPTRPPHPSPALLACAAIFGLHLPRPQPHRCAHTTVHTRVPDQPRLFWPARTAAQIDRLLRPGQIALVTGPSGSGKSILLRTLHARLTHPGPRRHPPTPAQALARSRVIVAQPALISRAHLPLADLAGGPLDLWLACLAKAGLAEARLLPQSISTLSEGQRWRVLLALCLARAHAGSRGSTPPPAPRPPFTIIADEFASVLDRESAFSLCAALRRLVSRSDQPILTPAASPARPRGPAPLRLILATAHDDVLEPLRPDVLVHVPLACADPENLDASPEVLMP